MLVEGKAPKSIATATGLSTERLQPACPKRSLGGCGLDDDTASSYALLRQASDYEQDMLMFPRACKQLTVRFGERGGWPLEVPPLEQQTPWPRWRLLVGQLLSC